MGDIYKDKAQGVTLLSLRFFQDHRAKLGQIRQVKTSFKPLYIRRTGAYHTVIRDVDGNEIWLSGCCAGYGGTGPHGTAFLLREIGLPVPSRLFTSKRKPVVVHSAAGPRRGKQLSSWLSRDLAELQKLFQWGEELSLEWHPHASSQLEGEAVGNTLRVYSRTRAEAARTLRHEFLDSLVTVAIEPYAKMADLVRILSWLRLRGRARAHKEWEEALNLLLKESENEAYRKKEIVVEKLSRMLDHVKSESARTSHLRRAYPSSGGVNSRSAGSAAPA
jgi:hypothetical protein